MCQMVLDAQLTESERSRVEFELRGQLRLHVQLPHLAGAGFQQGR